MSTIAQKNPSLRIGKNAVLGILTVQKYSSGPCAPAPPNMGPFEQL